MKHLSPRILFYTGIGLLNLAVGGMFLVITTPPPVATATPVASTVRRIVAPQVRVAKQGVPTRVQIPSLAIDLPVGVGTYDEASSDWLVDGTQAYYAAASVPSNDTNGNTLIYGHALSQIFARLPEIAVGGQVIVSTDTGYMFRYRYQSMQIVAPSDVRVFSGGGPPTLTLQTCVGLWSEYRGLYLFSLNSVQKL